MTLFDSRKEKLISELKDKEYRDAFVSEHIATGIPFQIKALREQREWSQREFGKKAGMHQERISVLEDPNYAKFSIATLKKLASAFNVGLVVRFVPISELVEWELNLSSESLKVLSFNDEPYFKEKVKSKDIYMLSNLQKQLSQSFACTNVSDINLWRKKREESHFAKLFETGQPQQIGGARP
jgi:transcriptional regulator with XRE-family HTH domain